MISPATVARIQEAIRIEEVVGEFVSLKKRGVNLLGLCPFHNEKTPSFNVNPTRNIFKCFGCGKGGDAITFLQEHEKLSFTEALKFLAQKYGIEVEETAPSPQQEAVQDERESLLALMQWAQRWFSTQLWESEEGRTIGLSYFKERGFTEATIRSFELGYSPEGWDAFTEAALKAQFSKEFLLKAGLTKEGKEGKLYDGYRGRVLFPIHNLTGKVVGLGGRTLLQDKKVPKYINSPENEIYHKSHILYGLYQARTGIRKRDEVLLVEGYTDVIALHQAGLDHAVASSGTSLTREQVKLLARQCTRIVLLFDADPAGLNAALRGVDVCLEEDLDVQVCVLPGAHDPDSYLKEFGAEALEKELKESSKDIVLFLAHQHKSRMESSGRGTADPAALSKAIKNIVQTIALIPDQIKAHLFIRECAALFDVEEALLIKELNVVLKERARRDLRARERGTRGSAASIGGDQAGDWEPYTPGGGALEQGLGSEARAEYELQSGQGLAPEQNRSGVPDPDSPLDSEDAQEMEIVRLLMIHGSGNADSDMVADKILAEIEDIEFSHPACRKILDLTMQARNKGENPDTKWYLHHKDKEVQQWALHLTENRHKLSPNWQEKWHITVPDQDARLMPVIHKSILHLKRAKLLRMMKENENQIRQAADSEEMDHLMQIQMQLNQLKAVLAKELGSVILR